MNGQPNNINTSILSKVIYKSQFKSRKNFFEEHKLIPNVYQKNIDP